MWWNKMQRIATLVIFSLLAIIISPLLFAEKAQAGNLQQGYVRFDRMKASTATTGTICAKPNTVATEADVQVVFPTSFSLGLAATFTVNTSPIPSGSTAWPGINTATTVSSQTVTFPSTDLTVGTLYCFNWANSAAVTTSTAGNDKVGTITTRASGPTTIDSTQYATSIISNDQIVITATVPATFTFSLSANTDTFASPLSTTAQLSNGVTATVATNAAAGWVVWVKSANAALNSVSTGATIATTGSIDDTVTSLTAANYGYLLDATFTDSATSGTGTVTQAAGYGQEYDGNSSNTGGTLSTAFQPVAAGSGVTDGDTVVLKELARVSAVQAAATDYTDTLTVVAAGRF